ncbi:MAG: PspA/IM30 family protein [Acidobacteriota bacterium]
MKNLFQRFAGAFTGRRSSDDLSAEISAPIEAVEGAIAELETSVAEASAGLSDMKAVVVDLKRQCDEQQLLAEDYEKRARRALDEVRSGRLAEADGRERASRAMLLREQTLDRLDGLRQEYDTRRGAAEALQARVEGLRREIAGHQNELVTLRARARTAHSMEKINRRLAGMDPGDALGALEQVRDRVAASEAMAHAYGELKGIGTERQLDGDASARAASSLEDLEREMGLGGSGRSS